MWLDLRGGFGSPLKGDYAARLLQLSLGAPEAGRLRAALATGQGPLAAHCLRRSSPSAAKCGAGRLQRHKVFTHGLSSASAGQAETAPFVWRPFRTERAWKRS